MALEKSREPLVSVIIPCRNSERTIRLCLTHLKNQQTAVAYDITVVDSSTDQTPAIVAEEFPEVQLIHLEQQTFAGAARNLGIKATQSTYCLMVDSDCLAEPDLIDRAVARHGEAEYAAVGGSLANGTPSSLSGLIGYLIEFKEFTPNTPMRLEKGIPTANVMYRRDALERFGGYDQDMWLAEDILLHWKMHLAGEQILFDPAIRVTHLNKTGWKQVLGYQVDLGRLSAVARRRGGLPGAFLLKYPPLVLVMPFVRLWTALVWFVKNDRGVLPIFAVIWPMYLLAATFWSFGFLSESWKGNESEPIPG